jgi:phage-related protein
VSSAIGKVKDTAAQVARDVAQGTRNAANGIADWAASVIDGIRDAVHSGSTKAKNVISLVANPIRDKLNNIRYNLQVDWGLIPLFLRDLRDAIHNASTINLDTYVEDALKLYGQNKILAEEIRKMELKEL